jgi:hypothetical protein
MLYNDHGVFVLISPLLRDSKLYATSQVTSHIFVLAHINIQMGAKKTKQSGARCKLLQIHF